MKLLNFIGWLCKTSVRCVCGVCDVVMFPFHTYASIKKQEMFIHSHFVLGRWTEYGKAAERQETSRCWGLNGCMRLRLRVPPFQRYQPFFGPVGVPSFPCALCVMEWVQSTGNLTYNNLLWATHFFLLYFLIFFHFWFTQEKQN